MTIDSALLSSIANPSIPQIQNPLDSATKALTMSNLLQEHQSNQIKLNQQQRDAADQQTMRDAYKNNTSFDESGNPVTNRQGVLSDLAKANPMLAQKQAMDYRSMDLAAQKQQMETMADQTSTRRELMAQIPTGSSSTPEQKQAAWQNMISQSHRAGLPDNDQHFPMQYPGDDAVDTMKYHLMTAEQQLAQQNKTNDQARAQQEADAKSLEARAKAYEAGLPMGGAATKPPATGDVDPATLVKGRVPQKDQPKVLEEIKNAQDIKALAPKIMDAFDRGSSRNPLIAAQGQKEFEGLINTTVKEQEGTARQAAFDSIHEKMTPSGLLAKPGENDSKRRTVVEYLGSKASSPTAKANGLDLSKYSSTALDTKSLSMGSQKSSAPTPHPQDSQAVAWAKNPKSPGWSKSKADAILKLNPEGVAEK